MSEIPQPPQSGQTPGPPDEGPYPLSFDVSYPDRGLDRVSTGFRIFTIIPIAIVLAAVSGSHGSGTFTLGRNRGNVVPRGAADDPVSPEVPSPVV